MRGSVGFAGMRMGRATDKGDEFPPPHVLTPKAKDHNLIITPRIAARSGHLCPLRVLVVRSKAERAISAPPVSAGIGQRGEHVRYVHHKWP